MGRYIFVDRDHDLCYYILGNNFTNDSNYETNKWGAEWGGFWTSTNIRSQAIGSGLSNTNSLIFMNLTSDTSGWPVVWDWMKEFRSTHSSDWFVPSLNELIEVYNQRSYLENLSLSAADCYWSSSEQGSIGACYVSFYDGNLSNASKNHHTKRFRLCFYL